MFVKQARPLLRTLLRPLAFAFALAAVAPAAHAANEVNLYTTREPKLIQPLVDAFTKQSGIAVNTVFVKDGLLERVKAEGARSPADVLMTVDIGNLLDLVDGGLTQPVRSASLDGAIPANLRGAGGNWYALSLRDRVLYVDKNMQLDAITYESLADPKWKGKVCVRSGQHPYNTALVAAMIAHDGEAAAEQWLRGVKANLARKATGGDRDVARDILGGICDIGLANAYYAGHMKHAQPGTDARKWGDAIKVVRPTFANAKSGGTHVNVSGAAVAKHAPNRDNAVKLLEYLASPPAQALYAQANYEYPVRAGVALDPVIAGFGPLKADPLPLVEIAKYRKRASQLVDKVGFDN
ncbi:bacterial extracellular solute-binding family protein [Burkholderia mallei NCTC 10247]|uniref:Ferric iron uptake ABC transporter (FeT) family, periplasmic iron-binding protein n=2 Tax=Burkholderia mallei TaxID=13373 RepID=A2S414_BURM9|nr:Fe(3+) ABC transporter substrate-binding protein [Burkholderia mallei]ABN03679.1 ferric iron uptake ABC transporter (FeT) family, periplasmic iron-binding protein [Burkholderia mallei NCTC 10229]ABO06876.1 ferric iron uptake ABC transporter (FeT) family, periplasmic iron-binding protein [Burkholderia mallei NCTC 10247]AIS28596.1 bacterial extracellular solute-binding family protein [Burkholderia mallei NCTC 10247]AJX01944.1 bacterial extracellular solute-binding family protein [Burkholderia 